VREEKTTYEPKGSHLSLRRGRKKRRICLPRRKKGFQVAKRKVYGEEEVTPQEEALPRRGGGGFLYLGRTPDMIVGGEERSST